MMSLVVMAFAFYEMSGGKDFVPRSETRRMAAEAAEADTPGLTTSDVSQQRIASADPARSSRAFTSSSRTEVLASEAEAATAPATTRTEAPRNEAVITAASASLYPLVDGVDRTPEVTLVSLADNPSLFAQPLIDDREPEEPAAMTVRASMGSAMASPVSGAADPAKAPREDFFPGQRDIRAVNGDRVNMRNGPGTSFSVMASLPRDTRVEVLTDPGDGWVRLRPINGGPVGWMADYLLTGG